MCNLRASGISHRLWLIFDSIIYPLQHNPDSDQAIVCKDRAKQKSNSKYIVYSPDDDISSDEEVDDQDGPEYEVDEDDTSMLLLDGVCVCVPVYCW